jgi:hypothetical protein
LKTVHMASAGGNTKKTRVCTRCIRSGAVVKAA